jgi:hypothetical protein
VARQALIRVEARPEPVVLPSCHNLDFCESRESVLEKDSFVCGEIAERIASARRPAPHTGIDWPLRFSTGYANVGRCECYGHEASANY